MIKKVVTITLPLLVAALAMAALITFFIHYS